jgi:hypothetical protein
MSNERTEGEHGLPVQPPDSRLAHETTLIDQRPRERRRDRAFFSLVGLGMVGGAGAGALVVWVLAEIVGQHYSPFVYIVVAVIFAGVVAGIVPYLSLARSDGADAGAVASRGRRGAADAPLEGAQAADDARGSAPRRARDV